MPEKSCSILIGRKAICNFLKISKNGFYEFVEAGMPVKKIGKKRKRWVGHCEEIESWGKKISSNGSN